MRTSGAILRRTLLAAWDTQGWVLVKARRSAGAAGTEVVPKSGDFQIAVRRVNGGPLVTSVSMPGKASGPMKPRELTHRVARAGSEAVCATRVSPGMAARA